MMLDVDEEEEGGLWWWQLWRGKSNSSGAGFLFPVSQCKREGALNGANSVTTWTGQPPTRRLRLHFIHVYIYIYSAWRLRLQNVSRSEKDDELPTSSVLRMYGSVRRKYKGRPAKGV